MIEMRIVHPLGRNQISLHTAVWSHEITISAGVAVKEGEMKAKFPVRMHGQNAIVAIRLPKPMGGSARLFLRETAKNQLVQLYHQPIETGISGRDNSGKEIPINSVGRWLFGTPGYMGHGTVRFLDDKGQEIIFLYPKDSPTIVHELVAEIKKKIEAKK